MGPDLEMENKVGDTPPKKHRDGAEVRTVLIPILLYFEQCICKMHALCTTIQIRIQNASM